MYGNLVIICDLFSIYSLNAISYNLHVNWRKSYKCRNSVGHAGHPYINDYALEYFVHRCLRCCIFLSHAFYSAALNMSVYISVIHFSEWLLFTISKIDHLQSDCSVCQLRVYFLHLQFCNVYWPTMYVVKFICGNFNEAFHFWHSNNLIRYVMQYNIVLELHTYHAPYPHHHHQSPFIWCCFCIRCAVDFQSIS